MNKNHFENLKINYYSASGNKTPVLDVNPLVDLSNSPDENREILENNLPFRRYVRKALSTKSVDSLMLYYTVTEKKKGYDYVMYVEEPNTCTSTKFSTMCGNGIRALSLHLYEKTQSKSFRIYAGGIKTTQIIGFNPLRIRVNMGKFRFEEKYLRKYVNRENLRTLKQRLSSTILFSLENLKFGLNGSEDGEPHAVLFVNKSDFLQKTGILSNNQELAINTLRQYTSQIGKEVTFDKDIFPLGISFSIAIIDKNDSTILMSTHERNLNDNPKQCVEEINHINRCNCNTLACGTAGAVVANWAFTLGFVSNKNIITIQPGGNIEYVIDENNTIMIGSAKKINK